LVSTLEDLEQQKTILRNRISPLEEARNKGRKEFNHSSNHYASSLVMLVVVEVACAPGTLMDLKRFSTSFFNKCPEPAASILYH